MNSLKKFLKVFFVGLGIFWTLIGVYILTVTGLASTIGLMSASLIAFSIMIFLVGIGLSIFKDYVKYRQNKDIGDLDE